MLLMATSAAHSQIRVEFESAQELRLSQVIAACPPAFLGVQTQRPIVAEGLPETTPVPIRWLLLSSRDRPLDLSTPT